MNAIRFWQIVVGVIGAVVVVAAIVYWLNLETLSKKVLSDQLADANRQIAELKSQKPVEVEKIVEVTKEVVVEVEKECVETVKEVVVEKSAPILQEVTIRVPKSTAKFECKTMEIGKWDMPKECQKELAKFVQKIDTKKHFLAITAVVDKRKFPGGHNELKQAGLAQFRVATAAKSTKSLLTESILIFSRKPVQTLDIRGFNIEIFSLENEH